MQDATHYVIRGGVGGRERLRILARVMHATTMALFDRLDVCGELVCLDVGCGGGDVTLALAKRVAPHGRAVGADIDSTKVELAIAEAREQGVTNVEFVLGDIRDDSVAGRFDVIYSRFLLTHLSDPASAVDAFYRRLRPGGRLIVEDIDFSGHFTYPESTAFQRYCELYCTTVRRRGGDPNIGPRLPSLLFDAAFDDVDVQVAQPVGLEGDVKRISPLTMQAIADAVVQECLASRDEVDALAVKLFEFADDARTVAGMPRIVQCWGRRPTKSGERDERGGAV